MLRGTAKADVICGLGGNDKIFGRGGNDVLRGGAGNDQLTGGYGADTVSGGLGNDQLDGSTGRDRLNGESGTTPCSHVPQTAWLAAEGQTPCPTPRRRKVPDNQPVDGLEHRERRWLTSL